MPARMRVAQLDRHLHKLLQHVARVQGHVGRERGEGPMFLGHPRCAVWAPRQLRPDIDDIEAHDRNIRVNDNSSGCRAGHHLASVNRTMRLPMKTLNVRSC